MKKPNILWIMTDQQKYNALSCLGSICNMTDNLDKLVADGILFENAYTPSPICGPARACLKTGCYPPQTGVVANWVGFKDDINFLPQLLKEEGYQTGLVGKLHFYPATKDYGFDKVWLSDAPYSVYCKEDPKNSEYISWLKESAFDKKGVDPVSLFDEDELSYENDLKKFISGSNFRSVKEHETYWTELRALEFLKQRDNTKPFFLYVSYFGPHQPYCPPEPYKSFVKPESIELPKSYYTDYKSECDVYNINSRPIYNHIKESLSESDCKQLIAQYYGQIKMIDESIGNIITDLKDKDLYEDTLIIFTSDHGDHLGEHGLFFKGQMYDSCVKVPLIIKIPRAKETRREKRPLNTIDLYKTVLDYAHSSNLNVDSQSQSLISLLNDENVEWSEDVYSIIGGTKDKVLTMLRRGDYKLIRTCKDCKSYYELYDLNLDKDEIKNLWKSDKVDILIKNKLKTLLDSWTNLELNYY